MFSAGDCIKKKKTISTGYTHVKQMLNNIITLEQNTGYKKKQICQSEVKEALEVLLMATQIQQVQQDSAGLIGSVIEIYLG